MGCLYYLFIWPIYLDYYFFKFLLYMIYYSFMIFLYVVGFFLNVVIAIIRTIIDGCKKSTNQSYWDVDEFSFDEDYETPKKVKKVKKVKEKSWEEIEFEREAELWGLSEEDKRIAKQERMSPADYVEAEEYDDDELLKDEWER